MISNKQWLNNLMNDERFITLCTDNRFSKKEKMTLTYMIMFEDSQETIFKTQAEYKDREPPLVFFNSFDQSRLTTEKTAFIKLIDHKILTFQQYDITYSSTPEWLITMLTSDNTDEIRSALFFMGSVGNHEVIGYNFFGFKDHLDNIEDSMQNYELISKLFKNK